MTRQEKVEQIYTILTDANNPTWGYIANNYMFLKLAEYLVDTLPQFKTVKGKRKDV